MIVVPSWFPAPIAAPMGGPYGRLNTPTTSTWADHRNWSTG